MALGFIQQDSNSLKRVVGWKEKQLKAGFCRLLSAFAISMDRLSLLGGHTGSVLSHCCIHQKRQECLGWSHSIWEILLTEQITSHVYIAKLYMHAVFATESLKTSLNLYLIRLWLNVNWSLILSMILFLSPTQLKC